MPFTQADIDMLKAAIVSRKGAQSIAFADQVVTFSSIDDMLTLLAKMEAEVSTAGATKSRTRLASTSKGL